MYTSFLVKCRLFLEAKIRLRLIEAIEKGKCWAKIYYTLEPETAEKVIEYRSTLELAEALQRNRIIDYHSCQGDQVKMYIKTFNTITGDKGEPVQQQRLVEVKWDDIELTPEQIITIAAQHELDQNDLVKQFSQEYFNHAA